MHSQACLKSATCGHQDVVVVYMLNNIVISLGDLPATHTIGEHHVHCKQQAATSSARTVYEYTHKSRHKIDR